MVSRILPLIRSTLEFWRNKKFVKTCGTHAQLFTYFIQAATAWSGTHSVGFASFSSTASHVELASEHAPVEDDPELWVGPWVAPLWPALASLPISMSPWRISLSELQARAALTLPLQPRQKKERK
jgi:hypothetical protein